MAGGNLDDLEFALDIDLQKSLQGLRDVVAHVDGIKTNAAGLRSSFDGLNAATLQLDAQTGQFGKTLEDAVKLTPELSDHWQYVNRDVKSSTDNMREFVSQTQAAASAMQTVTVNAATSKMTPAAAKPTAGLDLVKLAGAALAVKAVTSVSTAMTTARTTIASIDTTTRTAVLSLDRFRMGLAAPAVNPALNTLPGLIQKISGGVAGAVESFRGFGDATISGAPAIMTAIAGGMQKVLGSGDSLQATMSKITSQFDLQRGALDRVASIYPTTGTAVGMLKDAMNFIAPAAEKVAQGVDKANASVREAAISARNLAFVATGSFIKTGTSADLYAKGAYHALLPTRLMAFEAKFAAGSMGLVRRAFAVVTSPIHAVSMAMQRSSGEFRELRANLPPLTGGLQLSVRAMRAFSHATLFTSQVLSAIKTAATPITFLATKIYGLLKPTQAAAAGMRALKASVEQVAAAGSRLASSSIGSGLSSMAGGLKMGAVAAGALGVAMVGMATTTAMATEKNIAVFGTMVHSMEQGAAIVASIQKTKAAGLFDNQQLLDSSRLLFKGGVAAVDLAAKTDQLAKIAVGTSTELGDLARIYQQGANRGSFGQDKINQLSERGIAIYEGLQHATGKSGAALDKMISDGLIGVTEMDAAMAYLTTGTGYYANSLEDIGNTSSGMLSQIKNNLMQTLGSLGGVGNEAFKPVLAGILSMSEGIKSSVGAIAPIVNQLFAVIKGAFSGMHAVVNTTYTSIFGAATATFGGMLSVVMEWVTKFRWFFENIVPIVQFVGLSMISIMVSAFNSIAYWLTDTMPAYLTWFGENWTNIFYDIATFTGTIFENIMNNIVNAMTVIWDFIASGGTSTLEFAWTPLLTGFESTVAQLPDVPERAMTELEQSLEQQTQAVATQLADSFDALNVEAQAALTVAAPELPAIDPTLQAGGANTGEDGAAAGKKNRSDFSVSGMERGSEAALKAIFSAQKDKTPSQALAEHKKTNAHLATIANKPQPAVLGGVT
jgi:tape measure domain-containing protein